MIVNILVYATRRHKLWVETRTFTTNAIGPDATRPAGRGRRPLKHILFVDDETRILDGLRRLLRSRQHEWQMSFVESGPAALELMARTPIDVIVSDMRMPGMDGAELLTRVKAEYPRTIRIVLSGHAEIDAVMSVFGIAHQYLTKPTDPLMLKATIDRAEALSSLLNDATLKGVITGIENLPTLPAVYQKLVACLRSENTSLGDVGKIISEDVGMSVKILKIVNSAFFGVTRPITKIERATTVLGLEVVMALALDHGVFGAGTIPDIAGFDLPALHRRGLRTAAVARAIARTIPAMAAQSDAAFLSGVLHEVGQLVLAQSMPTRYADVAAYQASQGSTWSTAEMALLGTSHSAVGAYLLALWGFDNSIVEGVAWHEHPGLGPASGFSLPGLIHVAHCIAEHPDISDSANAQLGLDPLFLQQEGVLDSWPEWHKTGQAVLTGSGLQ
ncbi:MAG: response regulator [Gammaproteobacteria bacterium]